MEDILRLNEGNEGHVDRSLKPSEKVTAEAED